MEEIKILLMGKTGVGKSSFINYLLSKDIAETGVGKPVTQETKRYRTKVNGMKIAVYDTKGFEANISAEMRKQLLNDIMTHNSNAEFNKRYHSIFYCVSMGNPRLDKFEIDFLKEIEKSISQPVNFIITHCDNPNKNIQVEEMKVHIRTQLSDMREFPYTITPVCSVKETKRNGETTKPYGKEELLGKLFDQVWKDASVVMANKCFARYRYAVSKLMDEINQYVTKSYKKHSLRISGAKKDIAELLDNIPTSAMEEQYNHNIKATHSDLKQYREFITAYYRIFDVSLIDEMFDKILNGIRDIILKHFDISKIGISDRINKRLKTIKGKIEIIFKDKAMVQDSVKNLTVKILDEIDQNEKKLKIRLVTAFDNVNKEYRASEESRAKMLEALSRIASQ